MLAVDALLRTKLTVVRETPASRATSALVTRRCAVTAPLLSTLVGLQTWLLPYRTMGLYVLVTVTNRGSATPSERRSKPRRPPSTNSGPARPASTFPTHRSTA